MECKVCGLPTASKYGICKRTKECTAERQFVKRHAGVIDRQSCRRCGGPLQVSNRYGICRRNPACKREAEIVAYLARRPVGLFGVCCLCGGRIRSNNKLGFCYGAKACRAASNKVFNARWRRANPEKWNAYGRAWRMANPEKFKAIKQLSDRRYYMKKRQLLKKGRAK